MMTDHEGLATATLFALVGPFVCVGSHVFLQITLSGEVFAALLPVAIERIPCVESGVGVQSVERGEGVVAALHLAHERLFTSVDTDVDL